MLKNKIKKYYDSKKLDESRKRMLVASLSEAYSEQNSNSRITASHSAGKKNSDKPVYAKGPGLWGIGAAAAAVAIAAGASFFGGVDLNIFPHASSPASPTGYVKPDESGIGYFSMTIDGVDRTGENNNEICVENLRDYGNELTVKLEFPDMHIGESYGIKSATYCVFIDGYDTVDLSDADEFESAGTVFEYYSDDLTETLDGLCAEYTFQLYDHRDEDLAFSIVAVAVLEDYDGNYSMMLDSVYNTAYSDREKVSYLHNFSPDPYPMTTHMYQYWAANGMAGLVSANADRYTDKFLNIIGDPGDELYVEFCVPSNEIPEYAYENAYYLMTFVDGVLLPHSTSVDQSELNRRYSGLTMIDSMQCDGSLLAFCAPLYINELDDAHDVKTIAIPARPYGNNEVMIDSMEYYKDEHRRPNLEITIDGYERTGTNYNEVCVKDLGGDELTVKLRLGNSDGKINDVDIMGADYYIFLDGYSALDMTSAEAYESGYMQFISKTGNGKFTKTDDGWFAEYTFSFDDLNEISKQEKTFSIVALTYVDLDDDRSSDAIFTDVLYNTAYADQTKISYLEELYADNSPGSQGIMTFQKHYDSLLRKAGYYHDTDDPEFHNMIRSGAGIIENKDDGKVYVSIHSANRPDPEYLFESAYYAFTFVDDELVSLTDDGELYALVDCTDTDGNDRFLCAELGNISDISGVDIIIIPATPYSGNYGAYIGQVIGVNADPANAPF